MRSAYGSETIGSFFRRTLRLCASSSWRIVVVFTAEENVLTVQIIKTESGEELVVLPRREYDALMARLGDEEAEDRVLADAARQVLGRIESGEEALVPSPRKSSPT